MFIIYADITSAIDYLKYAYLEGRYTDCISVCNSLSMDFSNISCGKGDIRIIKLIEGKSLYYSHKNSLKLSGNAVPFQNKEQFKSLEKVIRILGHLFDDHCLDEEGSKILDIAMVDYIRETNNLNDCQRCLLCCQKQQLKSSHVIPRFILSRFTGGMNLTASKKVYLSNMGRSDEPKLITPRQAAVWMLCGNCEQLLSSCGESSFAKDFFHKIYKTTDPSMPNQSQKIPYSRWLYLFAAGIIFRGLAINPKGITGFFNENHVYQMFKTLREVLLYPDKLSTAQPQIAIFTNPRSVFLETPQAVSTLNRLLNMPGFMYLIENEEKLNYIKYPRRANIFIAHLGIVNVVVSFVGGDFALPLDAVINAESGVFNVLPEHLRFDSLPPPLLNSLILCAQKLEEQDFQITQKRLKESEIHDTTPPEVLKEVYGLSKAKQDDIQLIQKVGFQPSSDPRFPKKLNFLPPNISVKREADEQSCLLLPPGHKLLLHQTSGSNTDGATLFLCIDNSKLYVIRHRYLPGLHIDYGFSVSSSDLSPHELLPDKDCKVYAYHLLEDLKSSNSVEQSFSKLLKKVNLNVDQVLDAHTRYVCTLVSVERNTQACESV